MDAPSLDNIPAILVAADPDFRRAGLEAVRACWPAAVAALRAVVNAKQRPPLPEPPQRPPVAEPWGRND